MAGTGALSSTDGESPLLIEEGQQAVPRQRSALLPAAIAATAVACLLCGAALFSVWTKGGGLHGSGKELAAAGLSSDVALFGDKAVKLKSEKGVAAAVNHFGLSLMKALQPVDSAANVFISPVSISSVLAMITLGATGNSSAKQQLMGAWGLEREEADSFVRSLKQAEMDLTSSDSVQLLSANSIWCKTAIKKSFIDQLSKLGTQVKQLPETPAPINKWCEKATQGMIPEILNEIPAETVAVLVNAIYFKGLWEEPFQIESMQRGHFETLGDGPKPCAMMSRWGEFMRYTEFRGAQVVELPYRGEGMAALVVLPEKSKDALGSLSQVLDALTDREGMADVVDKLAHTEVILQLPRFKLEFGVRDLRPELLKFFNMSAVFEGTGEFLEMSSDPDVRLSSVLHKAVLEVNEEGTKAAAVTVGIAEATSMEIPATPPKKMIVDRPFMLFIRDRDTGMLLFAGTVTNPELDTSGI